MTSTTVPVTVEYSISEKGEALAHVFEEINRWKTEWDAPVQPASAMEGQ